MARDLPLEFLFDCEDLFAVYKPPGIHSVMQSGSTNPSIAEELLRERPALETVATKREDAGLINRLDHDTSGILLGASSKESWQSFSKLLKSGSIKKEYYVILDGELKASHSIGGWIGSPYRRGAKVRVYETTPPQSVRALPATSELRPIRFDRKSNCTLALVECALARRHQVRAHCATLGHPLLGDTLYGSLRKLSEVSPGAETRAFFLHAGTVEFVHPLSHHPVRIEAQLPEWVKSRFGFDHS